MRQFKEKNSNTWKWVLYAVLSGFVILVGYSIYHMTPGLWPVALFMCIASLGAEFVYTVYTTTSSPSMRRRAWICGGLVLVGVGLNVVPHAITSRRYDVAKAAREARFVEEERGQQAAEASVRRAKDLAEVNERNSAAQSNLIESQRRLTDSQSYQLRLVSKDQRRLRIPQESQAGDATAAETPKIEPTPILTAGKPKEDVARVPTPEEVQEQSWGWVLGGLLLEIGTIIGTAIYFGRGLIRDDNNNNVADWKEELDPEELAQRFPADYERLYGSRPRQSPNMSPTPAYSEQRPK